MASPSPDVLGCSHYQRKCKLVAPCCDTAYNCRFCHDEAEGHTVERRNVTEVECLVCHLRQDVGAQCQATDCRTVFGAAYFCSVCKLFDDEAKGQFHCDGCGICRVGGRDKFIHCHTCGLCLPKDMPHKCISNTSHNNCPVCMEDIHSSRDAAHIPPCSHLLHQSCYTTMLNQGLYACPLCGLSMQNMGSVWANLDREVAQTPMPREYADLYREILCRDCNKTTTSLFHVVGMKCRDCGSYNTSLEGPFLRRSQAEDGEITFSPLSDQELNGLSNVEISPAEPDSDVTSEESDSNDGWETTEEEDVKHSADADQMFKEDLD